MAAVWYFAYGSNMQRATFRGRRGIGWRRALPARAPGWRLVLDKPGIVPAMGSFANLVPDPAAAVVGVAYQISVEDLEQVELTEAVPMGNYSRVGVTVHPLAAPGAALPASTLVSARRDPTLRPTERYMALLLAGAEEHGLPQEWIEFLRCVPTVPETEEGLRLRGLMDEALRRMHPARR